jgi:hypothetical protein
MWRYLSGNIMFTFPHEIEAVLEWIALKNALYAR